MSMIDENKLKQILQDSVDAIVLPKASTQKQEYFKGGVRVLLSEIESRIDKEQSTVESSELLPCPFCGEHKRININREHDSDGFGVFYCVKCSSCGAKSEQKYCSSGNDCPQFYQEVRDIWNTRPVSKDTASDWVSVEDRLPENGVFVLITNGEHVAKCKRHYKYCWIVAASNDRSPFESATHWMPLPTLPLNR